MLGCFLIMTQFDIISFKDLKELQLFEEKMTCKPQNLEAITTKALDIKIIDKENDKMIRHQKKTILSFTLIYYQSNNLYQYNSMKHNLELSYLMLPPLSLATQESALLLASIPYNFDL